jgi:segregation and condensation protein A
MEQLKIDNDVINHLLFHKSLIDENDDAAMINYFVDMLEKTNEGEYISIENPFERSIAIAFELVIRQHLDPWDIDLVNFSTMYIKRAKEEKIDLITAGRIILMAWKILKLQSDNLVVSIEENKENEEIFDWDNLPSEMWLENDQDYSYTNLIMKMPEPPLYEPIRRDTKRKVTLMELLEAFNQARKESEEYQLLEQQRQDERDRLKIKSRKRMIGTAHEDNIEEDVEIIWKKINKIDKKTLSIIDLCDTKNRDDFIKTLISVLFLAYDNKIKVYQRKFPYGKIFIENMGYT